MIRVLLLLLPTLAVLGSLAPGIESFFLFRLAVIALVAIAAVRPSPLRQQTKAPAALVSLGTLWAMSAATAYVLGTPTYAGHQQVMAIALGLSLVASLPRLGPPAWLLCQLWRGWILSFLVTTAFAVREVVIGTRISNYLASSPTYIREGSDLVASVFGNPNNYGAYLALTFGLLLFGAMRASRSGPRLAFVGAAAAAAALTMLTGSRLSIVALAVQSVIFLALGGRSLRHSILIASFVAGMTLAIVGTGFFDGTVVGAPGKLQNISPSALVHEVVSVDTSTSGGRRANLYKNGLWLIVESGGLGVGPGGFQAAIIDGRVPYETMGVLDPHNLYVEIAAQYGLIVFLLFAVWIVGIIRPSWVVARRGGGESQAWGVTTVALLVGASITAMTASSYLLASVNWLFLAIVHLYASTAAEPRDGNSSVLYPRRYTGVRNHSSNRPTLGARKGTRYAG